MHWIRRFNNAHNGSNSSKRWEWSYKKRYSSEKWDQKFKRANKHSNNCEIQETKLRRKDLPSVWTTSNITKLKPTSISAKYHCLIFNTFTLCKIHLLTRSRTSESVWYIVNSLLIYQLSRGFFSFLADLYSMPQIRFEFNCSSNIYSYIYGK